jgi:hypothetical protein
MSGRVRDHVLGYQNYAEARSFQLTCASVKRCFLRGNLATVHQPQGDSGVPVDGGANRTKEDTRSVDRTAVKGLSKLT